MTRAPSKARQRIGAITTFAVLAVVPACMRARGGETPSCPQDRSAELGLQEDVRRYAGCTQLAGIVIRTGATIDLAPLADLEVVTGDVTIGPSVAIDEIAFNGLLQVGGTIRVANNGGLRGLFFPRLERAGRIEIDNNVLLTSISLPRLSAVDGALVITDNGGLEIASAPRLVTVGQELVLAGHPLLAQLDMSKLAKAGAVRIEANPKLPAEMVDQLARKSTLGQAPSP